MREQSRIVIILVCEALAKTVQQETFNLVKEQVEPHSTVYPCIGLPVQQVIVLNHLYALAR